MPIAIDQPFAATMAQDAAARARQPFASARDVSNDGWKGGASFGFRKSITRGDRTMEKKRISAIPTDLSDDAVVEISGELRKLLADVFALYVKTKNFHWHMSGRHFRDYHLLLDEHGSQIFAMTDDIAERARKIGGTTMKSVSDISKHQRLKDNNAERVAPEDMLAELRADNHELTRNLRSAHELCEKHSDVATASLIENWIDETERRTWFLSEIVGSR
jgi:starvation-inducible DNA-binding protein